MSDERQFVPFEVDFDSASKLTDEIFEVFIKHDVGVMPALGALAFTLASTMHQKFGDDVEILNSNMKEFGRVVEAVFRVYDAYVKDTDKKATVIPTKRTIN